jgi:PAT family beta-lactamase induction signal transducer AmpG
MALAAAGKSYPLMVTVIGLENLSGGMGTAAYVALLMALCDRRYSATQYALLSALSAVGRVYVGPVAGYLVAGLGWESFFFFTFLIALPGLALLVWQRPRIEALDRPPAAQV